MAAASLEVRVAAPIGRVFDVIVDYAHTGAALRKAVEALRPRVREIGASS